MTHERVFHTPGEVLRDYLLNEWRVTQDQLARAMGVSRYSVNQLVNGRRAVTAEMALRLSRATNTTPEFWLNLQIAADLSAAKRSLRETLKRIHPVRPATDETELFHDLE